MPLHTSQAVVYVHIIHVATDTEFDRKGGQQSPEAPYLKILWQSMLK